MKVFLSALCALATASAAHVVTSKLVGEQKTENIVEADSFGSQRRTIWPVTIIKFASAQT